MSVKIRIPTPLRKLTAENSEVTVEGDNVGEVLGSLEKAHPGIKDRLFDEDGNLRRFVNVYVGEEDIRFLKGLDTEVPDGTTISIIPAVAGGL